jgi:PhzF family phenazine biosynthesis protein
MELKIYQVDAFADRVFAGNPAAIVPLSAWLADGLMQQIAMENNLSETAFFVPLPPDEMQKTGAGYHIRWFTPQTEIDLCGHATLAAAHIINHVLELESVTRSIHFITEKAGLLKVMVTDDWYTLEFPARAPEACPEPEGLLAALGVQNAHRIMRSRDYLVVIDSEQAVKALKPDFEALKKLDGVGVIVTAPGDTADAVSRCFFPKAGVNEDPVTGSAHCTIIPYWAERLGKDELVCRQLSARGGTLVCVHKGYKVLMSGKCILYMEGVLHLPKP